MVQIQIKKNKQMASDAISVFWGILFFKHLIENWYIDCRNQYEKMMHCFWLLILVFDFLALLFCSNWRSEQFFVHTTIWLVCYCKIFQQRQYYQTFPCNWRSVYGYSKSGVKVHSQLITSNIYPCLLVIIRAVLNLKYSRWWCFIYYVMRTRVVEFPAFVTINKCTKILVHVCV